MQPSSFIDSEQSAGFLPPMQNRVRERLREIITNLRISQATAAKRIGISPSRLNNYLKEGADDPNLRTPDLDMLMQIARGLGVTTDYLLGFSGAEPPDIATIVQSLLELEGMDAVRAEAIAETVQEALRVLAALPGEGPAEVRSRIAAQAAWHARDGSKPTQ